MKYIITICICLLFLGSLNANENDKGNVIFIHPDGTGGAMWNAMRMVKYGPDQESNWDKLEKIALYKSHVLNSTNSSSHGGATVHAYGTKILFDTYGNVPENPVQSLSGSGKSIMVEAIDAGLTTALINSGHICEPGTGVFAASSKDRSNTDTISIQIIYSGLDLILSGGEVLLIPENVTGFFGEKGRRKDGRNLIQEAIDLGYTVVYTKDELVSLNNSVDKVLGVFAPYHTFNDKPEEYLAENNLPCYLKSAPTVGEMLSKTLEILKAKGKQIFVVVEEEGTDNFGNCNNAAGTLEALDHTDDAIATALAFMEEQPNTLIIMSADSEAGGFEQVAVRDEIKFRTPLPAADENGAPIDGVNGSESVPFQTKPDKNGRILYFGITWATYHDVAGSVLARAQGMNSNMMKSVIDNTDIYRIMYKTLFGLELPAY